MIKMKQPLKLALVLPLVLVLAACSSKKEESVETGLLQYIPADTPYAMVTRGQLPDDLYEKLKPKIDEILAAYQELISAMTSGALANAESEDADADSVRKVNALVDEFDELLSIDGLAAVGIDRDSHIAVFGHGLLPVMRVTLSDGALLEAKIASLESSAGDSMSTDTIDGHSYRYVSDDEWRFIVAIIDNDLVMTVVPDSFGEELLQTVLGLTRPAQSIAETDRLTGIADKYDFEDIWLGLVDVEKVVAMLINEPSGINAALFANWENDPEPLDAICKAEIQAMAGIAPRFVAGYTELSTERIASRAVIELREDIARGVATFSGAVPGLGQDQGGLFAFGMSFDLLAMREFYADRLDAIEAKPYECELLSQFQAGVAQGRDILNQPIPPIAYQFGGFLAEVMALDGMDLANGIPPSSADMRLLVATENSQGLLAMGAMFSPDIAAMNIQADGKPVPLEIAQIQATGQTVYVAMSDTALALSSGEGMQDGLAGMLAAPTTDPSPFMSFNIDAARYYEFISQGVMADPDGDLEEMPELKAALEKLMTVPADVFARFKMDVVLTENGVEFDTNATLND